jgi:hypothetical protein
LGKEYQPLTRLRRGLGGIDDLSTILEFGTIIGLSGLSGEEFIK